MQHRGHILAINSQVELAIENSGECCLNYDGAMRSISHMSQFPESGTAMYKKYFPFVCQLLYVIYKVCISWEPQNGWAAALQCYRTNPHYCE